MQVTAEHAEAVRQRSRRDVEERLLFDRIALHAADVPPWDVELAIAVAAHFADADRARRNRTAMPARHAADPCAVERLYQLSRPGPRVEHVLEGGHSIDCRPSSGLTQSQPV